VEEAVQASKVHLLSTDHLEQAENTWKIPFDPSLKEVTVSLSGPSPMIEIHNPLGELYEIFILKIFKNIEYEKNRKTMEDKRFLTDLLVQINANFMNKFNQLKNDWRRCLKIKTEYF